MIPKTGTLTQGRRMVAPFGLFVCLFLGLFLFFFLGPFQFQILGVKDVFRLLDNQTT